MTHAAGNVSIIASSQSPTGPAKPRSGSFREFLSELNPLQYLPVVGTIYRAVTGDTIPESARIAGSMVVSGLMGGPVGLAISIGSTLLEQLSGIDPERIAQHLLASIGDEQSRSPAIVNPHQAGEPVKSAARAFTPAELASYGVQRTSNGDCRCGTLVGADVLNSMELRHLSVVA